MTAKEALALSGAVGAGGAGFPTHVKLSARVEVLIANAAECEPLLHSNQELIRHDAPAVIAGLLAAAEMVQAKRIVIAIKAKYKEPIAILQRAIEAAGDPTIEIHRMPDFYPAGDEHVIVSEVTGRIVPENGLPLDVGVVVQNVETLANVAAALKGQPVVDKWVTVTGAVANPVTLRVPVGTPIADMVAAAGGATVADWVVIDGGPMMGRVITDPSRPITKTTSGLLVLPRSHPAADRRLLDIRIEARRAATTCIRCRLCTDLCPRYNQGHDLHPHQVMQSLALFATTDAVYDQSWLCSECGICEVFSCPMGLSPRRVMAQLKQEFGAAGRRYQKTPKEYAFRNGALDRRVTGKRLLVRMALDQYDRPAPYVDTALRPSEVILQLRQHIGAAASPLVKQGERVERGQLIAEIPPGKLGAPIHASVTGTVTEVTADEIRIREVGANA